MALSTISTRIALEGAQEILTQLAQLGQAGERSVQQIQAATAGSAPALSTLSTVVAAVRSGFASAGEALSPVRASFVEFGEAVSAVGSRLGAIAGAFGIGITAALGASIAGFVGFIKNAAESTHQLEQQAAVVGLTTEQLQAYRKVAKEAGVSAEELFTGLSRLAKNVGDQQEKLNKDVIKFVQSLPIATSEAGTAIARGFEPAAAGIKSHIIGNIVEANKAADEFVKVFATLAANQGTPASAAQLDAIRQSIINTGGAATKTAEELRAIVQAATGISLPAATFGESLRRGLAAADEPLQHLGISLKDIQDAGSNLDPVYRRIIDGLLAIPNPADRANTASKLLGRGYTDLVEAFRKGSISIDEALAALRASGGVIGEFEKAVGREARGSLNALEGAAAKLRDQLALIFAPVFTEAAKSFLAVIRDNAETLKAFARDIVNLVLPAAQNLLGVFGRTSAAAKEMNAALPEVLRRGGGARATSVEAPAAGAAAPGFDIDPGTALPPESKLDAAITKFRAFRASIEPVLTAIKFALDLVAGAINFAFGTNLNASGAAVLLFGLRLTGLSGLILPLTRLLISLGAALAPLVVAAGGAAIAGGAATGAVGLLALAVAGVIGLAFVIAENREKITQGLSDIQVKLGELAQMNIGDRINALFANVNFEPFRLAVIGALNSVRLALDAFLLSIATFIEVTLPGVFGRGVQFVIDRIDAIANAATRAARAVAGLFGGGGGGASAASPPAEDADLVGTPGGLGVEGEAFAAGGRVRGPSGTDTVPAWLTPGEFVVRVDAVQHYGAAFLAMLNDMRLPLDMMRGFNLGGLVDGAMERLLPAQMPLQFAGGGAVPGVGPHGILNLTIGAETIKGLIAPGHVYDQIARHARSSAMRSAGRKPGWFS